MKKNDNRRLRDFSPEEQAILIEENKRIYDEHFNPEFSRSLVNNIMAHIDQMYFRSRFIGFEEMPERNNPRHPLIYIGNHSGMAFPWDAMIFASMLFKRNRFDMKKCVRPLAAPMLSQSTLMNPFLVNNFWKRSGGIDATTLNFETMMQYEDSNTFVYPEGVPGIGKGFNKRYQLQRFATSFIRMSLKYRTDVIPVMTINGEYINPFAYSLDWLNKMVMKIGIPFLPVGFMTLLIPFQPWMFYFGLPAQLVFVMGEPIRPYEMTDTPFEDISETEIRRITDAVKEMVQKQLDEAVASHGRRPYKWGEFFANCLKKPGKMPYFFPPFWPSLFQEFDRCFKPSSRRVIHLSFLAGLKAFFMNPITIAFFLPIVGWIPILLRGFRKKR